MVVGRNPYLPSDDSVGGDGFAAGGGAMGGAVKELKDRVAELETHVATQAGAAGEPIGAKHLPELTTLVRHSLQPDLDALNRAVRRYEKRSVLLSMQTEKRLQELETRMGDAIALAAAAERRGMGYGTGWGSVGKGVVEGVGKLVLLPVRVAVGVLSLPGLVTGGVVGWVEGVVGGGGGGWGGEGGEEGRWEGGW